MRIITINILLLLCFFVGCDNPNESEESDGYIYLNNWFQSDMQSHYSIVQVGYTVVAPEDSDIKSYEVWIKAICGSSEYVGYASDGAVDRGRSIRKSLNIDTQGRKCSLVKLKDYNLR